MLLVDEGNKNHSELCMHALLMRYEVVALIPSPEFPAQHFINKPGMKTVRSSV